MREVNAFWNQYYDRTCVVSNEPMPNQAHQPIVVDAMYEESIVLDDDDEVEIVHEVEEDVSEQPVYVMIRADGSCMGVVSPPDNDIQPVAENVAELDTPTGIIELDDSDCDDDETQNYEQNDFDVTINNSGNKCPVCAENFIIPYV